jgi:hypothetical protein
MTAYTSAAAALSIPCMSLQFLSGLYNSWATLPLGILGLAQLAGFSLSLWLGRQMKPLGGHHLSFWSLMVARAAVICLSAVLLFLASNPTPSLGVWPLALCGGLGLLAGIWSSSSSDPHAVAIMSLASTCSGPMGSLVLELAPLGGLPVAALVAELTANSLAALYMAGGLMAFSGLFYSLAILLIGEEEKKVDLV